MNQRRALDGVIRPLAPETTVGDSTELIVDEREEGVEGILVAFFPIS